MKSYTLNNGFSYMFEKACYGVLLTISKNGIPFNNTALSLKEYCKLVDLLRYFVKLSLDNIPR